MYALYVCGDVGVVLVQAVGVDAIRGDRLLLSSRQLLYRSPHILGVHPPVELLQTRVLLASLASLSAASQVSLEPKPAWTENELISKATTSTRSI